MKLLSPSQNKDARQTELTRQLLRAKEVEEIVNSTNLKLAKSEADFNASLARNRTIWAKEEEEHAKRIKEMEEEVAILQAKKDQALIPIEMYKKEADSLMLEAKQVFDHVKNKEIENEQLKEILEEKLSELSDRENSIKEQEQRIITAKEGIKSQQETTALQAEMLSSQIDEFRVKRDSEERELQKRKNELFMAEANFEAKIEKYKRDLDAVRKLEIKLKDERATLDREYARLKAIPPIK